MKEVKSGERQKGTDRWEMWFWATSICCINHIRAGLEHKRTYGSLAALLVFLSSFFCWISSTSQTSLILFRLSCPCPCPVRGYSISGYCAWEMMLVSARPAGALMNYRFPHGGAAKPTGTNNLWHTAVWVLIDYLLFRRRWFALDEPCKMTIIEWNFDLTKISALAFGDGDEVKKACKHAPNGVFLADLTLPLSTHINSHLHPTLSFYETARLICLLAESAKVIWN